MPFSLVNWAFSVLPGYFEALTGDAVEGANSTLPVFSTPSFAKCFSHSLSHFLVR